MSNPLSISMKLRTHFKRDFCWFITDQLEKIFSFETVTYAIGHFEDNVFKPKGVDGGTFNSYHISNTISSEINDTIRSTKFLRST